MKNYTIVLTKKASPIVAVAFCQSIPHFGWYSKEDAKTLATILRSNLNWRCKIRKMTKEEALYHKAWNEYLKSKD